MAKQGHQRFRPKLAAVYSGHNSYAEWGPPPPLTDTAVVVGYEAGDLRRWFVDVRRVSVIRNAAHVDNDEAGQPVWVCRRPRASWVDLWPQLSHLG